MGHRGMSDFAMHHSMHGAPIGNYPDTDAGPNGHVCKRVERLIFNDPIMFAKSCGIHIGIKGDR